MNTKFYMQRILNALVNRYRRYYVYPKARQMFRNIKILNSLDSIQYIIENRCSLSRYGDGEFDLMHGKNIPFQVASEEMARHLKEIFYAKDVQNFKIGIPYTFKNVSGKQTFACDFWGEYVKDRGNEWLEYFNTEDLYLDSLVSRFFKDIIDYDYSTKHLQMLKQIWHDREIVIVEGNLSRTGVGNDLYDNAKKIERILGYATDAYFHYGEMMEAIKAYIKPKDGKLILLSYGPTATVLAYDLAKLGYQAIDMGHLDMEYEWYLRNERWIKIDGKYVNEAADGHIVGDCYDEKYLSQVICDITKK